MVARVLIIGGYGNFGSVIAERLARDAALRVLIAGRNVAKAQAFAAQLHAVHTAEAHALDIRGDIDAAFASIKPEIVIHTTGPFQTQSYAVAQACMKVGAHYIDLADARAFVTGITKLDARARAANVLVVSGASSVPALSAGVLDHYGPDFAKLEAVDYGISAAQQTNRGLATTAAILSYAGKPITYLEAGRAARTYGWQSLTRVALPQLGTRWFSDCDIPDLDLFPQRYPTLRTLRFRAGHEIPLLHMGLWGLSWLVRTKLLASLQPLAEPLLWAAKGFDWLGTDRSGFYVHMTGLNTAGQVMRRAFYIVARSGHGPHIPCIPAILLAQRLARGAVERRGATPCLDLVTLADYLDALEGLDISVHEDAA
jgi:NAD(P)-dependent dehydrogenase (short-subunit alcohol dehydrogenase family)